MFGYLASWLPGSGGGPPGSAPQQSHQLNEQQLHELHEQWLRMQSSHQAEAHNLMGRLVAENNELKDRLAKTERDLKDVRAGRKADEEALRLAEKEIQRLTGGNMGLAVAILDFEADLFAPEIFHQHNNARAAADALHRKLGESLQSLRPAEQHRSWTFAAFIFWRRNARFVQQLISHGFFASASEFDAFIDTFNRAHPLFVLILDTGTSEQILQRERAFAHLFAGHPLCYRLILGRWAYDLPLAEMLAPAKAAERGVTARGETFPVKIVFVEPHIGFYLPGQLLQRKPQTIGPEGLLRRYPLTEARMDKRPRDVDFSRPLWQQNPPICLDHYLSHTRCIDECCAFSHSYRIPPDVLEALRFEVSRTPCALVLAGHGCSEASCHFAHACPLGARCSRRDCRFAAAGMHPPTPVRSQTAPNLLVPHPSTQSPRPPSARLATGEPAQGGIARSPASPSSTRAALARLLSGGAAPGREQAAQLAPSSPASPSRDRVHHLLPASPFGHPLSLADAELTSAPPPAVTDAVDLTDEELARLLAKARTEEEEYARGLQEDAFGVGPQGAAAVQQRLPGAAAEGTRGARAGEAAAGDGRGVWDAAFSGRGSQATV